MTTIITPEIKSEKIHLRITPSQKENWRALAEAQGVSLAAWIENKISMALASNNDTFVKEKYKLVSLFSGCGGMDLGFCGGFSFLNEEYKKTKFEITWANEFNPNAVKTYKKNFSHNIIEGDIWGLIDLVPTECDVLIGGFPCQDISINGKRAGVDGKRSGLYLAMVEAVKRSRPKIFIAENVKGLLMKYNEESLARVINDFSELGYNVSYKLYNSANFGVPQTRERVFIVGTLHGNPLFKEPVDILHKNEWLTCHDAIHDLEKSDEDRIRNHIWSKAKKSPDQGSRRLKEDKPSQTIRAECHGNIQFHYKLDRRISMREAARLQSFPDNFVFESNLRETERQVGNAVPPVLAWHLAQAVQEYLDKL
ncbi:Modification methylase HaeIII [compost metagenome]|uniref:DNA cytosine methyltransferase n=1 Tax=Pectobacterium aroidearum TaxID=1201031 RepID=UPI000FB5CA10|nr:DNA cytosine methyltransferase [Pectobacterium aroidearum]MDY4386840.1 DNA cytosine methyltransferase [Pectobacterium aroidearum]